MRRMFDPRSWLLVPLVVLGQTCVATADSNATGGEVLGEETLTFVGGPWDAAGALGSPGNGTFTGSYTGGFNANRMSWSGTQTSLVPDTWAFDSVLGATDPSSNTFSFRVNPSVETYSGQIAFSGVITDLTGVYPTGVDPAGSWSFEFSDDFDDGPGVDQTIDSFALTFSEVNAVMDSNGSFSLGTMAIGDTATSVGEMGLAGLVDSYSLTLAEAGILSIELSSDPNGFMGFDLDTEIGLFDSSGALIATNDDISFPGNTFSALQENLAAGDYTITVSGWDTDFSSNTLAGLVAGDGTGDYSLSAGFTAVPEPTSGFALFSLGTAILWRRRSSGTVNN